jgi:hypothetical protein
MTEKLIIDRHFLFLHGERLAVFAERILRNTLNSPYVAHDEVRWQELADATHGLRQALDNPLLKRKMRTGAVREQEARVLLALNRMADYVEQAAPCKSDVFTTGFRPQSEQRRAMAIANGTRRQLRMSAKMARLEGDE